MDGWVDWEVQEKKQFLFMSLIPHSTAVDSSLTNGTYTLPSHHTPTLLQRQWPFPGLPEKSHLLILLLILADDLGGGDAHLYAIHHKLACPLEGFIVQP